jgi:hypothetical protein
VLTLQLFWVLLFGIRKPSLILMQVQRFRGHMAVASSAHSLSLSLSFVQSHQNPPAIPSMVIVYIVCKLRGAKLVIDWHNFGYRCVVCVSCVSCAVVCGCRVWVRCSTAC